MTEGQVKPPHANRGVVRKNEKDEENLTSMVDYVRVSFKTHDVDHIIRNILHIHKDFMTEKPKGFYGYVGTWEMDMIKVMYSAPDDERGTLIEFSGKGCRQFESFLECRKKTWFDFFQDCLNEKGSFTRLDIAIDDKRTYFTIPSLLEKAQNGLCVSRFRKSDYNGSFDIGDGRLGGTTLYFGSKKSDAYLCFYEKNFEQAEKYNIPYEEMEDWNRYEIRLKNERAHSAVCELIKDRNLTSIGMAIINNYVRFVEEDGPEEKRMRETSPFWLEFIGDVKKLRLYTKPQTDFYQKSRNWLKNSCAPTMKMILEADRALGQNDLSDMIINAELQEKHEKMLETFLTPIHEMVV
ncbi:replication initiation factor domain-containing protein [Bacillus pumilus]